MLNSQGYVLQKQDAGDHLIIGHRQNRDIAAAY